MSGYIRIEQDDERQKQVSCYVWSHYNKDFIMDLVRGLKANSRPTPQGVKIAEGIIYDIESESIILSKERQKEIFGEE